MKDITNIKLDSRRVGSWFWAIFFTVLKGEFILQNVSLFVFQDLCGDLVFLPSLGAIFFLKFLPLPWKSNGAPLTYCCIDIQQPI